MRTRRLGTLARRFLVFVLVVLQGVSTSYAYTDQEIRQAFRAFDANSDGRISREEFELRKVTVLFRRDIGDVQRPDRAIQIRFEDMKISRAYFDELDQNGDGVLTGAEIIGAPSMQFEAIDTNHDGFIEYEELAAFMHRIER